MSQSLYSVNSIHVPNYVVKDANKNAFPISFEFKKEGVKRTKVTGYMKYGGLKMVD